MHTDEYEISLGRELAVCEQYVRKYQKLIADMTVPESGEWAEAQDALRHWSSVRDEYARLLRQMRISR